MGSARVTSSARLPFMQISRVFQLARSALKRNTVLWISPKIYWSRCCSTMATTGLEKKNLVFKKQTNNRGASKNSLQNLEAVYFSMQAVKLLRASSFRRTHFRSGTPQLLPGFLCQFLILCPNPVEFFLVQLFKIKHGILGTFHSSN